jgi:hypothetical protein
MSKGLSNLLLCLGVVGIARACTVDLDCSLNGVCSTAGVCTCDAPWQGAECGVLGYNKTTPSSGFSLYTESDPRNTWNGAIIRNAADGVYHLFAPVYPAGALGGTTTMLHGIASDVAGPYAWGKRPDITIGSLPAFDGPKSVVYTDPDTNKTMYSLWLGGGVLLADSVDGPFKKLEGFAYPGSNPAVFWHEGAFYFTNSPCETIYTTPRLVAGAKWAEHGSVNHSLLPENWIAEDPTLWADKRGNFHIINHAYSPHEWQHCASSALSTHFFSADGGRNWHFLPQAVQPYAHTVDYDDGTSHMFVTIERPSVFFDQHGQLTHLHLGADLVTGDEGCGARVNHTHFGHCPCDNCKYEDHGGTTIIALDV